jgi:hypothetical protein
MSACPTYYKQMNNFRYSGVPAGVLLACILASTLKTPTQNSGFLFKAIRTLWSLCLVFSTYVSSGMTPWEDNELIQRIVLDCNHLQNLVPPFGTLSWTIRCEVYGLVLSVSLLRW